MKVQSKTLIFLSIAISFALVYVSLFPFFSKFSNTQRLLKAIENDEVEKVCSLLENGVDPNRTSFPTGTLWTLLETSVERPLSIACRVGNQQCVETLIQYGATAEPIKGTGFSPLEETLIYFQPNDPQIVRLLLDNGASYTLPNGELSVFSAAQMIPKVYDASCKNGSVFGDSYDEATAKGITEIVNILLSNYPIDVQTKSGKTLLMIGIEKGNVYLVKNLVDAGCDIYIKDSNGKTAYDYAVQLNNEEIIAILKARQKTGDGLRDKGGTRGRGQGDNRTPMPQSRTHAQ